MLKGLDAQCFLAVSRMCLPVGERHEIARNACCDSDYMQLLKKDIRLPDWEDDVSAAQLRLSCSCPDTAHDRWALRSAAAACSPICIHNLHRNHHV